MKTPSNHDPSLPGSIPSNWAPTTSPVTRPFQRWNASSKIRLLGLTMLLGVHISHGQSALDLLQRFNVLVGDYNMNGETEGSVFVNGSFNPGGTHQIGFNAGALPSDTDYALWLNNGRAGTASGQTQIQSGSILSRVPVNPGDFILNGNAPGDPGITSGTLSWESTMSSQLGLVSTADAVQIMKDASAYWAGLASNSAFEISSNTITFNATPISMGGSMVAIFTIDAADITDAIGQYTLNRNGADVILINVTGETVSTGANKNFIGDFVGNESRTLFNFEEATSVTLNSNMRGTVFAPNAEVTQSGSNLDGSVVAQIFNQSAEVHDYNFDGNLPIPEPASAVLAALGAVILLRRERTSLQPGDRC